MSDPTDPAAPQPAAAPASGQPPAAPWGGAPDASNPATAPTGAAPQPQQWHFDPNTGQPIQPPAAGAGTPGAAPGTPVAPGETLGLGAALSLASIVALVLAFTLEEHGINAWDNTAAWSGFALACAVLTSVPALRASFKLTVERAWQIGALGAAGLVLHWVLLTLPGISSNLSFLATIGAGLGVAAVWLAPGRPDLDDGEIDRP